LRVRWIGVLAFSQRTPNKTEPADLELLTPASTSCRLVGAERVEEIATPRADCPGKRQGAGPNVIEKSKTFLPLGRGVIEPVNAQPALLPVTAPTEDIDTATASPNSSVNDQLPAISASLAGTPGGHPNSPTGGHVKLPHLS
jgi:hypothetical protein